MEKSWLDVGPVQAKESMPLHTQVKEAIRAKIKSGVVTPGDMLPPEVELAEVFNVSRATVRHAILDMVQEGLLRRVRGQGTYVQQQLRPTPLETVTFICPFMHGYVLDLIEGIQIALKESGHELLLRNSKRLMKMEAELVAEALNTDTSGVILWPAQPEFPRNPTPIVKRLLTGAFPAVIVDSVANSVDAVTSDNFGGGFLAGEHLLRLGRKRIGFVTKMPRAGQIEQTVQARWEGLQEAILNSGSQTGPDFMFSGAPDVSAFQEWLTKIQPDALFCATDAHALWVIGTLSSLGYKVPEEIAVVGFDDNKALAPAAHPPLTTVRQDFNAMGRSAGRLLIERISSPDRSPRHIVLPVRLKVRNSCGQAL